MILVRPQEMSLTLNLDTSTQFFDQIYGPNILARYGVGTLYYFSIKELSACKLRYSKKEKNVTFFKEKG